MKLSILLSCLLLASGSAQKPAPPAHKPPLPQKHFYSIVDLGTLGGKESNGESVNDDGQVVGMALSPDGPHAFLYDKGKMRDLDTLGGAKSTAFTINSKGQIAGQSENSDEVPHAFLYSDGQMTDLGTLGGAKSAARGINEKGQVVGWAQTTDGTTHAFLWQDGEMTDINGDSDFGSTAFAINNAGQIVGQVLVAENDVGNADAFAARLAELLDGVREVGAPLADDALEDSDLILPPADATLEEVRDMLADDGLIPG